MTDSSSHNLISAYVDDRLSPEERAEVEALLQSSPEARAELDSFRQLRKTLKALPTEPAPRDLVTRVMAQAEQESLHGKPLPVTVAAADGKGSFRKRWTIPALSMVATVGLVLLVVMEFKPPQDTEENVAATNHGSSRAEVVANDSFDDATARDETTVAEEGTSLGGDLPELERNLTLTDQLQLAEDSDRDGTINMFRSNDLRTAEVGDVIEALQVQNDRVVVVRLNVIDRQRFLDDFYVMLSGIPAETRGENNYGERKSDMIAVYVKAGEGRLKALMAQLQKNMDVEQMVVSRTIPPTDLYPYVAEQGYSDVWGGKNRKEPGKDTVPGAALDVDQPVASNEAAPPGERNRSPRPGVVKQPEADFDAKPDNKKSRTFRRSTAESEYPPPPPLPTDRESQRDEPDIVKADTALAEPASEMPLTKESDIIDPDARQLTLRISEADARKLIGSQPSAAPLSMSNRIAADRQMENPALDDSQKQTRSRREPLPPSGFAGRAPAEKPAAPLPEPAEAPAQADEKSEAEELGAALAAPKPDAVTPNKNSRDNSLSRGRKGEFRPLQVLFVLTDEAVSAVPPAPSNLPEAKQAPPK